MQILSWARWASALGVSLAMWGAVAPATAAPTAHDFFRNAAIDRPQLSPDGKHLALIAYSSKGDERRTLAVAPVDNPRKLTVVAHFDDADVGVFEWVNNQRLVFGLVDLQEPLGKQKFYGLYAVNMDSSEFVWLVARQHGDQDDPNLARRPLRANHVFHATLNDGSDDVILKRYNLRYRQNEQTTTALLRLNTKTKAQKELLGPFNAPEGARRWVLDQKNPPEPRAAVTFKDDVASVLVREPGSKQWTQISESHTYTGSAGAFSPLAFDADGQLYVSARQDNPQGTSALYRYDMQTRRMGDTPLLSVKGYDLEEGLIIDRDTRRLIGVRYISDAQGTVWFDPGMKAVQEMVDKLLPATVNVIACGRCVKAERLVVTAYSDRLSPVYMLFDRASNKLQLIGASRPWIDDKQMAEQDVVRIQARDGFEIPLLVTRPKGKGPWPAVVLVHGGPNVRGTEWGWNADSQFLASRGYLVVEPEFRGSKGYGFKHFKAGWKQWGLAMQDDVTDATKWAVTQGLADPKRIAIAGASYGGYATMMGLVKEPDLYRAGINWVGVTDMDLLYDIGWSDTSGTEWEKYGMPTRVGDPEKDRAQFDATSPLKRAKEITKPVLMAYGDKDLRVPLPHGKEMRDALTRAGKVEVEWVVYEDEGHGWLLVKNKVDFWTRVEKFLAKHLQ